MTNGLHLEVAIYRELQRCQPRPWRMGSTEKWPSTENFRDVNHDHDEWAPPRSGRLPRTPEMSTRTITNGLHREVAVYRELQRCQPRPWRMGSTEKWPSTENTRDVNHDHDEWDPPRSDRLPRTPETSTRTMTNWLHREVAIYREHQRCLPRPWRMGSTEKWPSTENTRDVNHDHDEWDPPRSDRLPRTAETSTTTMTNGLHREVAVYREHQRCLPRPWRMGSTEKWPSTENTRDVNHDHDEWDPPRSDRLPRTADTSTTTMTNGLHREVAVYREHQRCQPWPWRMGFTEKSPSTENTRDVNHDHDEWASPRSGRLPRTQEMSTTTMTYGLHREVAVYREHQRCQPWPWRMGSTEKWPSTENTRDVNYDHDEWAPPRTGRLSRTPEMSTMTMTYGFHREVAVYREHQRCQPWPCRMGSTEKWPSTENTRDVNQDHDEWAPPRSGPLPRTPEISTRTMTNGLHREVALYREHQRCQPWPWRMGSTEKWPSTENTRDVNNDHDEWASPRSDRLPRTPEMSTMTMTNGHHREMTVYRER